ncbi:MAG TPA: hypothetical protein VEC17_02120 [Candidatus Binatia bacterium]|nr:hypothetical protein [Candidatus Binatia bacterium]
MEDVRLNEVGQNIFEAIMAVESTALRNSSTGLSDEIGSYSRTANPEQTQIKYSFKIDGGIAEVFVSPNPEDLEPEMKLNVRVDDNQVLDGKIKKQSDGRGPNLFAGIECKIFVDGKWADSFKGIATILKNKMNEATQKLQEERKQIEEGRIQRKLNES